MRRFLSYFLLIIIVLTPVMSSSAAPPKISAKAAILYDVESKRILYELDAYTSMPIASLTKIMTAIVAIEEGNLDDRVTAGPNAVGVEGSSIYLTLNEKLSLEDLLYGLMLVSGNDAAVAIAEHIGGSVEGFVFLMNQKAELLGLENTHFANPHGLDHPEHYSSAYDLARLTAYALENPTFQKIVSTQKKHAPLEGEEWDRTWTNKNKMLRLYPGADGVKTGYTSLAKRTLVSSATRDGRQLVVVTLNDGNDWEDTARLFDYGFDHYQMVELLQEGQQLKSVKTRNGVEANYIVKRSFKYPLQEGELKEISSKIELLPDQKQKNAFTHGYIHLYLKNELIGRIPIEIEQLAQESFHHISHQGENNPIRFWQAWILFWKALL